MSKTYFLKEDLQNISSHCYVNLTRYKFYKAPRDEAPSSKAFRRGVCKSLNWAIEFCNYFLLQEQTRFSKNLLCEHIQQEHKKITNSQRLEEHYKKGLLLGFSLLLENF